LQVYNCLQNDTQKDYDGSNDGILNYNGQLLFTHELLHQFLLQGGEGRLTFSGFWRATVKGLKRQLMNVESDTESSDAEKKFVKFALEQISRPMMERVFVDCVFDYIQLLDIDYKDAFQCMCATEVSDHKYFSFHCVFPKKSKKSKSYTKTAHVNEKRETKKHLSSR
jgi:hypothetical protein